MKRYDVTTRDLTVREKDDMIEWMRGNIDQEMQFIGVDGDPTFIIQLFTDCTKSISSQQRFLLSFHDIHEATHFRLMWC